MSGFTIGLLGGLIIGFCLGVIGSNLSDKQRINAGMMISGNQAYRIEKIAP